MHDGDRRDGRDRDRGPDRGPGGGPEGTEFLDLEITKLLYGQAEGLAREAVQDILRSALRERLRERLGPRLEALARVAADTLADDIEANLRIEGIVGERGEAKRSVEARVKEALASTGARRGTAAPRDPGSSKGRRSRS